MTQYIEKRIAELQAELDTIDPNSSSYWPVYNPLKEMKDALDYIMKATAAPVRVKPLSEISDEDARWIVVNGHSNLSDVAVHIEKCEIRNDILCIEWWALKFDRQEYYLPLHRAAMPYKFADFLRYRVYSIPYAYPTPTHVGKDVVSFDQVHGEFLRTSDEVTLSEFIENNYTLTKK